MKQNSFTQEAHHIRVNYDIKYRMGDELKKEEQS